MKNPIFYARCPCCGEKLAVDTKQRRLDAADKSKAQPSALLDQAPEVLQRDDAKRKSTFDQAFDEETRKKKPTLDDLM
jgi:hypothetical protein